MIQKSDIEKINKIIDKQVRSDEPGFVISVNYMGKDIVTRAVGMADLERNVPLSVDSVMDVASICKQFVAASVLIMVKEDRISLKSSVFNLFPDCPDYAKDITIANLLYHTNGLKDYMDLLETANMREENRYTREEIIKLIFSQDSLSFNPGEKFEYSNSGYILLAEIIEKVTGKTLADYTEENIFIPMGMTKTLFYDNCRKIVPNRALSYSAKDKHYENFPYIYDVVGDTGLLTTVEDLVRWGKLFIDDNHNFSDLVSELICDGKLNDGGSTGYGGGLFLCEYKGLKTICHGGSAAGYRSDLLIIPEKELVITFISNFDKMEFISWGIADLFISDA